jgi:hypothetical protein
VPYPLQVLYKGSLFEVQSLKNDHYEYTFPLDGLEALRLGVIYKLVPALPNTNPLKQVAEIFSIESFFHTARIHIKGTMTSIAHPEEPL